MEEFLTNLQLRICDDLEEQLVLFVPPNDAVIYNNALNGWAAALSCLPEIQIDVEEASKCFALHRYTATVFHLMRVMEAGLDFVALRLAIPGYLPSWDAKLKKIEGALENLPASTSASERIYLNEARVTLRAVQTAWRNPTMHIEKVYSEEIASDVMGAVRGFMRHIATPP